ncbi:MAG: hypothetical protein F2842_11060 [Actinobacteria bacterium]|nr:hypothetical protein [Actinomycetota bacterium]
MSPSSRRIAGVPRTAALMIVTPPMIAVCVAFHRRIAQGLTQDSLK